MAGASGIARFAARLERWLEGKAARVALSLAFSLVLCLFLALCVSPTNSDDDWSVALYLSGRVDGQGLSLFLNALLSQAIFALNNLAPALNWFFVLEHATAFAAFAALTYGALSYVRRCPGLVMLGFLALYLLPQCISTSNYTVVAFLATCAGGFMLVGRMGDEMAGMPSAVTAVALAGLGLMWRFQMFLVGVPFVGIAWLWRLYGMGRAGLSGGTAWARVVAPAVCVFVACGGLFAYDHVTWQQDGWREWSAYNAPRTITSDYPMPDYAEAADELRAMSVSENDYWMIRNWANADADVLDTDAMTQVASLRSPLPGVGEAAGDALDYVKSCVRRWKFFAFPVVVVLLLGPRDRRGYAIAALELLLACAVCVYYVLIERLIDRVEDPTWGYALCMCVVLSLPRAAAASGVARGRHVRRGSSAVPGLPGVALTFVGPVVLAGMVALLVRANLPMLNVPAFAATFGQTSYVADAPITAYIQGHPDNAYVIESGLHTRFEREYELRYLPAAELAERVMPLGGWGSGSPFRKAQSEARGATNPVGALVADGNTLLIADAGTADHVLTFLREHYDPAIAMESVEPLPFLGEGVSVWKFTM